MRASTSSARPELAEGRIADCGIRAPPCIWPLLSGLGQREFPSIRLGDGRRATAALGKKTFLHATGRLAVEQLLSTLGAHLRLEPWHRGALPANGRPHGHGLPADPPAPTRWTSPNGHLLPPHRSQLKPRNAGPPTKGSGTWPTKPPDPLVRGEGSHACTAPASLGPSPRALPGGAGRRPSRTLPADCAVRSEVSPKSRAAQYGPRVTRPGTRERLPERRRGTPLLLSEAAGMPWLRQRTPPRNSRRHSPAPL